MHFLGQKNKAEKKKFEGDFYKNFYQSQGDYSDAKNEEQEENQKKTD